MVYTVYKTTNQINGMFYIGVHETNNPYDGYLGSGYRLKNAIKKYGKKNFKKNVLFILESKKDADIQEKIIVTSEFLTRDDVYNLALGGLGGTAMLGKKQTEHQKRMVSLSQKGKKKLPLSIEKQRISLLKTFNAPGYVSPNKGKIRTEEQRKHISETHADVSGINNPNFGNIYTEEFKQRLSIKAKQRSKISCIKCGISSSPGNHTRWHGENCRG